MKNYFLLPVIAALIFSSSHAFAQAPSADESALFNRSLQLQQDADLAVAQIRSVKQFNAYLASAPSSVAFKLPPSVLKGFTRSMVFTEKGLASYSYNGLTDYLSTKEIYELLSLFGVQKTISAIPGIFAKNSIETKIIEGNTQIGPAANRDTYCLINGPQRLCRPEYRSICSQACGP